MNQINEQTFTYRLIESESSSDELNDDEDQDNQKLGDSNKNPRVQINHEQESEASSDELHDDKTQGDRELENTIQDSKVQNNLLPKKNERKRVYNFGSSFPDDCSIVDNDAVSSDSVIEVTRPVNGESDKDCDLFVIENDDSLNADQSPRTLGEMSTGVNGRPDPNQSSENYPNQLPDYASIAGVNGMQHPNQSPDYASIAGINGMQDPNQSPDYASIAGVNGMQDPNQSPETRCKANHVSVGDETASDEATANTLSITITANATANTLSGTMNFVTSGSEPLLTVSAQNKPTETNDSISNPIIEFPILVPGSIENNNLTSNERPADDKDSQNLTSNERPADDKDSQNLTCTSNERQADDEDSQNLTSNERPADDEDSQNLTCTSNERQAGDEDSKNLPSNEMPVEPFLQQNGDEQTQLFSTSFQRLNYHLEVHQQLSKVS